MSDFLRFGWNSVMATQMCSDSKCWSRTGEVSLNRFERLFAMKNLMLSASKCWSQIVSLVEQLPTWKWMSLG